MGNVLDNAGFRVAAVTTGKDALEKIKRFPEIKLIILNYLLPDMSGLTVLERLRESGSQVRAIAVSAMKEAGETFIRAGVFAFLEKPFDINEFIILCEKALNGKNADSGMASLN